MATQILSGEDGIIEIDGNEVPCLREWTLQATANINSESTKCMLSNGDGGSTTTGGWEQATLTSKNWNATFTFFWQETAEGAAPDLSIVDVGKSVAVKLYPNKSTTGKKEYSGNALITDVSIPSNVDNKITQTVTVTGDGDLAEAAVV
jgi:hypothetical protein